SSSVAVMRAGVIEQVGTPQESYDYPRTRFVAAFLGSANLLEGRVVAAHGGGIEGGGGCFRFEGETASGAPLRTFRRVPFKAGARVTAAVRPEGVRLAARPDGAATPEPWAAVVETAQFLGDAIEYRLKVRDRVLRARCDRAHQFKVGDPVRIELRAKACTVVADWTQLAPLLAKGQLAPFAPAQAGTQATERLTVDPGSPLARGRTERVERLVRTRRALPDEGLRAAGVKTLDRLVHHLLGGASRGRASEHHPPPRLARRPSSRPRLLLPRRGRRLP